MLAKTTKKKLQKNAENQQQRRSSNLDALSNITNSTNFREDLNRVGEGDEAVQALTDLLFEDTVSMEQLQHIRRLGEGGFAYVELYEKDLGPHRVQYAVKVMKDKATGPPLEPYGPPRIVSVPESERIKFYAEALLMRSLRHKNVVGCFGCVAREEAGEDGTTPPPKLIQEFCAGGSLLDQIQKPRYSAVEALTWLQQTAQGMAYLHKCGGMHRDLKPDNVLLTGDGTAKVADFGLFRMSQSKGALDAEPEVHEKVEVAPAPKNKRMSGMFKKTAVSSLRRSAMDDTTNTGTARYMAPECYSNHEHGYTNKIDVFSFAILAHELLTRKRAYADLYMTMEQVAKAVSDSGLRPKIPKKWCAPLCELLQNAWAAKAAERPSFEEIAQQISDILTTVQQRAATKAKATDGWRGGKTIGKQLGVIESKGGLFPQKG